MWVIRAVLGLVIVLLVAWLVACSYVLSSSGGAMSKHEVARAAPVLGVESATREAPERGVASRANTTTPSMANASGKRFRWFPGGANSLQESVFFQPSDWTFEAILANETRRNRCRNLSRVPEVLGLGEIPALLGKCAVVGGSGILSEFPRGAQIDQADFVFRVNGCPTRGWERLVGSRTSVRLANIPRSVAWMHAVQASGMDAEVVKGRPAGADMGDAVIVHGGGLVNPQALRRTLAAGQHVAKGTSDFRRECANALFDAAEVRVSILARGYAFEPTFGFEAVASALVNCQEVDVYGFLLREEDMRRTAGAMRTRYHYWENASTDARVRDRNRPWSYEAHDFQLEARTLRRLARTPGLSFRFWTEQSSSLEPVTEWRTRLARSDEVLSETP